MEINEAQNSKELLEKTIKQILMQFNKDTGLTISNVYIYPIYMGKFGGEDILFDYRAEVEVKL